MPLIRANLSEILQVRPYEKVTTMSFILFKASVPFVLYIAAFSYAQTCYTPDGKAVDRSWGDL